MILGCWNGELVDLICGWCFGLQSLVMEIPDIITQCISRDEAALAIAQKVSNSCSFVFIFVVDFVMPSCPSGGLRLFSCPSAAAIQWVSRIVGHVSRSLAWNSFRKEDHWPSMFFRWWDLFNLFNLEISGWQIFKRLYENAGNLLHVLVHLVLLESIRDVCKRVVKELTSWVMNDSHPCPSEPEGIFFLASGAFRWLYFWSVVLRLGPWCREPSTFKRLRIRWIFDNKS